MHGMTTTIKNGRATAIIAPSNGGGVAAFWWDIDGQRLDWLKPATEVAANTPANQLGCFPLVPFFGRIGNGRFSFRGTEVRLHPNIAESPHAVHGHGWQRAWSIDRHSEGCAEMVYEHRADDWPWAYQSRQAVRLDGDGALSLTLTVKNLDASPMPAGLGFHPYFPRQDGATISARLSHVWEYDDTFMPLRKRRIGPGTDLSAGPRVDELDIDAVFEGWKGPAAIGLNGGDVIVSASPGVSRVVVVARPAGRFFTFEPVTHVSDAFNLAAKGDDTTGMITLAPGEVASVNMKLQPRLRSCAGLQAATINGATPSVPSPTSAG